jgi:hypothetical protein
MCEHVFKIKLFVFSLIMKLIFYKNCDYADNVPIVTLPTIVLFILILDNSLFCPPMRKESMVHHGVDVTIYSQ